MDKFNCLLSKIKDEFASLVKPSVNIEQNKSSLFYSFPFKESRALFF